MKKILVIMAKKPEAGKVKTRLCPPLSPEQAAELYRCFLADRIAAAERLAGDIKEISLALAFDPPTGKDFFQELVPARVGLIPQSGRDLGERLINLFDYFFGQGYGQVVITDSDSPTLPFDYLRKPFEPVEAVDIVLGPTQDGGYYLIGLRKPEPGLFQGIDWSTGSVLEQTMAQARKYDLAINLLPSWYDVDTPQDLIKLQSEIDNLSLKEPGFIEATQAFFSE